MKLRLGQPVNALDGPFGELGDIVVDPVAKTVTHVVVQPIHKHHLARLVPMWMVTSDDESITVQVDVAHLRQLQAASFSDYVRLTEPIDLGEAWDIGTEDVVSTPFVEIDPGMWGGDGRVGVSYDRIPRGEVEIRHLSRVHSSDDHDVGHVAGFATDGDHVTAIAVRMGRPGRRHDALVAMDRVERVRNDRVVLSMTLDELRALPATEEFDDKGVSLIEQTRERIDAAAGMVSDAGHDLVDKAKSVLHRHD